MAFLLVFDEVITGFGRLGAPFASQAFGVTPDIMTMAKALTNGCQPMGAVAVRDEIYDTVVDSGPDGAIEFFHGLYILRPSRSLRRWYRDPADIQARGPVHAWQPNSRIISLMPCSRCRIWTSLPMFRGYGLIAGIDVKPGSAPGVRGTDLQKRLFWNGLHIKFTGDAGIIAPPLTSEKAHIDELVGVLRATLEEVA